MTDTTPIPCVVYAAKSTTDTKGSIGTQLEDCRAAVEREGKTILAEYHDENASGFKGNRGGDLARAKEHAIRDGAEFWVQHSDRVARGDGITADHLAEVWFALRRHGVRMRSVQDDHNLEDAIRVVLIGERNNEDSKRKAGSVADGMARSRTRGDAGWLFRGIQPDGWVCLREFDSHGQVIRTAVKDPDRREMWELCWTLAREGASAQAIQLEFSSRGYETAPVKRDVEPRPFDVHRIDQALRNPIYAGLVTNRPVLTDDAGKPLRNKEGRPLRGELVIVGDGDWPRYVERDDWHAIQSRRAAYVATRRPGGRPPSGYLLTGLARCGLCGGSMQATTYRAHRKDAPRSRRYLCAAHREYDSGSAQWCPAGPVSGELVDRIVLAGLDVLLADVDALRSQLGAGHHAERARLRDRGRER